MNPTSYAAIAILGDGGLARSTARRLSEAGYRIVLSGRSSRSGDDPPLPLGTVYQQVDATDFAAVQEFLEQADQDESLAGVVNCAGSLLLKPAHLTTEQEYSEIIAANLTTAFATVRAAGRLLNRRGGSVVLVSSAAVRIGLPNHEAIAAAKGGIEGLVRSAASTYGPRKIRFNAIAPGLMETPMTERITGNEKALETSRAMHALGRIGSPDEAASIISWLLGPDSSWVTGQVWGIDGGLGSVKAR
jgi:NAD(P)-dependent dehydrogenase (short-subunit alcohol dehydrogenase family)